MRVTLDTNVLGPLASPADYPNHPAASELATIRRHVQSHTITATVSEGSLALEALDRHVRIDVFFREWATRTRGIARPEPSPVRAAIFERAFELEISVLHVPRLALGSFVIVPDASWAPDTTFTMQERHSRSCSFMRAFSAKGPEMLNALGAELLRLHAHDSSEVMQFPCWPLPEELLWLKGIVAEYDNPLKFASPERLSRHIRDLVAEWTDVDILASHFGYGNDIFCTLDEASSTGTGGILHPSHRASLETQYGISVLSPHDLVHRLAKGD